MTNVVSTIITVVVTNWSSAVIHPAGFEAIRTYQKVPQERVRIGVVEEVKGAQLDYNNERKYVVLEKKTLKNIQQEGIATETVEWGKITEYISTTNATREISAVSATNTVPVKAEKKAWWKIF